MPQVLEYCTPSGNNPYLDFMETVRRSGDRNALRRFQDATVKLPLHGLTLLDTSAMDNIDDDIYELRIGPYRVLCFYDRQFDVFMLLNRFRKRTQRTPESQKARARALVNQYLEARGQL